MWVTRKQRHDRSKVSNCSGIYIYVQLPGQWAHWWSSFLYLLGFETTLYQHIPGMCRQIPGGSWFGEIHYSVLFHLERNGCSCGCPDGPICFTDLCLSFGSLVADSCLQSWQRSGYTCAENPMLPKWHCAERCETKRLYYKYHIVPQRWYYAKGWSGVHQLVSKNLIANPEPNGHETSFQWFSVQLTVLDSFCVYASWFCIRAWFLLVSQRKVPKKSKSTAHTYARHARFSPRDMILKHQTWLRCDTQWLDSRGSSVWCFAEFHATGSSILRCPGDRICWCIRAEATWFKAHSVGGD